jgi:hypothetical protein
MTSRPQERSLEQQSRPTGIDARQLDDETLLQELGSLHRTRLDALRHSAESALTTHLARTRELELEYLRRRPAREVDPRQLR